MNKSCPPVSVIVPFFRQGALASRAIDQLQAIDYPNVDFILVDDGSDDDTAARLTAHTSMDDRFRTILLPQNLGPGGARNAGIAASRGEYIWFADSDDSWEPAILRTLVQAAQREEAEIVFARGVWTTAAGARGPFTDGLDSRMTLSPSDALDAILVDHVRGYLWNKLFHRSVLDHSIFPDQRTREDLCGLLTALQRSKTVAAIPDAVYYHLRRENSVSRSRDVSMADSLAARLRVHELVAALPRTSRRDRLLDFYDFRSWILDDIRLAARIGDETTLRQTIRRARRSLNVRTLLNLARTSPRVAREALLISVLGRPYVAARTRLNTRHHSRSRSL